MSVELDRNESDTEVYEQYRALSTAAVASLIVGLLSCVAVLDWSLVAIPLIGIRTVGIRAGEGAPTSDELSGENLARAGLALSLLFAVGGPARLTYEYVTEIPTTDMSASRTPSCSPIRPSPAR